MNAGCSEPGTHPLRTVFICADDALRSSALVSAPFARERRTQSQLRAAAPASSLWRTCSWVSGLPSSD
jgi:hypothetical protein